MKNVFLIFFFFLPSLAFATERVVNLTVAYKSVYYGGQLRKAIAVNDQIPAPTLHFKMGDHVTINVTNCLDQPTAIHWHGVFVPWQMDGVEGVSQKGIPPGGVFHYQFTLEQSGTYWYHAHAGLQEQQGLYGAFIIDPPESPKYHYSKDFVMVLSDWSNTDPDRILANLKKSGDYYSPCFPLQPSLFKFLHDYCLGSKQERMNLIDDYKMMQQMRMNIYDLSDVAYNAFLLNGQTNLNPWKGLVKIGETVRLRFIGASGDTIYHVKIIGAEMQMVHVQGNDVEPYMVNDFTIAPGETYDVLVKIQKNSPYIIYAEARNTLGAVFGALVTDPHQCVNYSQVIPFPEPPPVTREMMMNMMSGMAHSASSMMNHKPHESHGMKMNSNMKMDSQMKMDSSMKMNPHPKMTSTMKMHSPMDMHSHMQMTMPLEPTILGDSISNTQKISTETMGTKYQNLKARIKTNDTTKPIAGVINMELFGYMDRFIWFINGLPEYKAHPIHLEPGKRYRIIFTNQSMMHHPMHIHGHWFILRNGHGDYDPLLHTIDVPPGAKVTTDVDTDASGQWFFHCHLLYHMVAGMSRVFQYSTLIEIAEGKAKPQHYIKQTSYFNRPIVRVDEVRPIDISLIEHPMAHPMGLWFSSYIDVGDDPYHQVQRLTYKGLYGSDYHKLELFTNDAEVNRGTVENADIDIFYWNLISQFWAIKAGANYTYRPANVPYWQPGVGIEGLMPYFIDTNIRSYFYGGSFKLDAEFSRDTQITNNFFIRTGIRSILASKTVRRAIIGSGMNQVRFIVRPYYRVMPGLNAYLEYEHEQDYGTFRTLVQNKGDSTSQNTLTLGVAFLF